MGLYILIYSTNTIVSFLSNFFDIYLLVVCANSSLIGNGFCNDQTNNEDCMYDEGECCGTCANMEQCSDCQCLEGSPTNYACKLEQCI